jgi:glutaconyl-CoA/methylmalonyl-CoA decarboxylase subunit gamma
MKLRITIHGRAYEVDVEVLDAGEGFPSGPLPKFSPGQHHHSQNNHTVLESVRNNTHKKTPSSASQAVGQVNSPIAGTILEIKCKVGDAIQANQELMVIEAMKMETSIAAPTPGTISSIEVAVGDSVREGQTLIHLS